MTTETESFSLNISAKPGVQKAAKKKKPNKLHKKWQPKVKEDLLQRTLLARKQQEENQNESSRSNKLPSITPSRKDLINYIKKTAKVIKPKGIPKVKSTKAQKRANDNETTEEPESKKTKVDDEIEDQFAVGKPKSQKQNGVPRQGKISSLFGNNPLIPKVDPRLVKPIKEKLFTGKKFDELPIHPHSVKNLLDLLGISELTSVQQKAIPVLLEGCDALIRSQTGSGKTLTYALPIIEALQAIRPKVPRSAGVRALIVLPTRELALQTYELLIKLVKPFTWIVPGYLVGGEKRKAEKARIRKGITVLVGTPGRLLDHVEHTNTLDLSKVRFFVLDEADRMLDMGYERDVKKLIDSLQSHKTNSSYDPMAILKNTVKKFPEDEENDPESEILPSECNEILSDAITLEQFDRRRLQTVLLSATLTAGVQKLAGLTLTDPKKIDASNDSNEQNSTVPIKPGDVVDTEEQLSIPDSVQQTYVLIPPKLRLVTLSSFIIGKANKNCKVLVFMATQDMVDFHTELLNSVLVKGENDKDIGDGEDERGSDSESSVKIDDSDDEEMAGLVDVQIFKLHGSMSQHERTDVFKTFRKVKTGVLFCTDVASRGLDLPKVDSIIQYTGPTCAADYVHRVGRTARAGAKGEAIVFLSPHETEFVRMLENRRIKLRPTKMDFSNLSLALDNDTSAEASATILQQRYETATMESKRLKEMACKAYSSWVRFYACYPKNMRKCFSMKDVHLGHYAKSFALRDAPSAIGSGYRGSKKGKEKNTGKPHKDGNFRGKFKNDSKPNQGRNKRLVVSEFESGLAPSKKKKKK